MSVEPLIDEDYASEEDSDFAPDGAPADDASAASESDNDGPSDPSAPAAQRKRTATGDDGPAGANDDYDNSGDEAVIHKGQKRRRKEKARDVAAGADDDGDDGGGGEGGLVKTRSMRAAEKAERKTQAQAGPVTINVEDLWAQMTADPIIPPKATADTAARPGAEASGGTAADAADAARPDARGDKASPPLIRIKRTYNFAGKVHTEEKMVPRDSAEARVYLASLGPGAAEEAAAAGAGDGVEDEGDEVPKRQPRKAFRSAFEPVVEGLAQRADLQLGVATRLRLREQAAGRAKKLNVVEKSRMDWAGFVDQAGIKDELELAGKSKESYASRQDFLARVDAKKEDDARRARMAGRA